MNQTPRPEQRRVATALARWLDNEAGADEHPDSDRIDWLRTLPFIAVHLACLSVIWVGVSAVAVDIAVALYAIRMFAIARRR